MISVCIAAYNGEKYIERQLMSILCQLGDKDEIVVSDDGSSDNTLDVISRIGDKRIKIVDGAHRHSPIWNFEKALQCAEGNYIFLADQDDEWLPGKVETCLRYLQDYDCIVSDNIVVDGNSNVICDSFFALNRMHQGKYYNLLIRNNYIGCCMAFNRNVLERVLPFPNNIPLHDIWIGNVAAFNFRLKFIPEKLIKFYRHEGTSSTTGRKSSFTIASQLKIRLNTAISLIKLL